MDYFLNINYFPLKDVLYKASKDFIIDNLNNYVNYFDIHQNELNTKYLSKQEKEDFIYYYSQLNQDDKSSYQNLYQKIMNGGSPTIELLQKEVTVSTVKDFKWNDYLKVYDNEDGYITLSDDNISFSSYDGKSKGDYVTNVIVKDSDGNESSVEMTLHILSSSKHKGCKNSKDIFIYLLFAFGVLFFISLVGFKKKKK